MNEEIRISDHALLRYLERVRGIDLEELRQEVIGQLNEDAYETLGEAVIPAKNHPVKFVVKNRTIITIKPQRRKKKRNDNRKENISTEDK